MAPFTPSTILIDKIASRYSVFQSTSNAKLISKFDTESDVFGRYSICLFPAIGLSTLNISEKSSH